MSQPRRQLKKTRQRHCLHHEVDTEVLDGVLEPRVGSIAPAAIVPLHLEDLLADLQRPEVIRAI